MENIQPIRSEPYNSKTFEVRIPEDVYEDLRESIDFKEILSERLFSLCERYRNIRDASFEEIKDNFSKDELRCLASFVVNLELPDNRPCNGAILSHHLEESSKAEELCNFYEVDRAALSSKVDDLSVAQADALYFWIRKNKYSLEDRNYSS